ncbi:hypothetical protein DFJ77DRAFT_212008 [Powellomyces hirtus]|nr:hypothetical protein DFJ77DRAFT_212008 [Powellomyces hirtus]
MRRERTPFFRWQLASFGSVFSAFSLESSQRVFVSLFFVSFKRDATLRTKQQQPNKSPSIHITSYHIHIHIHSTLLFSARWFVLHGSPIPYYSQLVLNYQHIPTATNDASGAVPHIKRRPFPPKKLHKQAAHTPSAGQGTRRLAASTNLHQHASTRLSSRVLCPSEHFRYRCHAREMSQGSRNLQSRCATSLVDILFLLLVSLAVGVGLDAQIAHDNQFRVSACHVKKVETGIHTAAHTCRPRPFHRVAICSISRCLWRPGRVSCRLTACTISIYPSPRTTFSNTSIRPIHRSRN